MNSSEILDSECRLQDSDGVYSVGRAGPASLEEYLDQLSRLEDERQLILRRILRHHRESVDESELLNIFLRS